MFLLFRTKKRLKVNLHQLANKKREENEHTQKKKEY